MKIKYAYSFSRLIIWLVTLNIFVATIAVISVYENRLSSEKRAQTSVENLSLLLDDQIADSFKKIDIILQFIAESSAYMSEDTAKWEKELAKYKSRLPYLIGLRISDAAGNIICGYEKTETSRINISGRDYFIRLSNNPGLGMTISQPILGRISNEWVVVLARPISKTDGSFAGVVTASVPLKYFQELFASIKLGTKGSIGFRDTEMRLIVRHPAIKGVGDIGVTKIADDFRAALNANPDAGTYIARATSIDGVRRLHSFRRNAAYHYYINVGFAEDEFLSDWRRYVTQSASLALLFFAVSIIFARYLTKAWKNQLLGSEKLQESEEQLKGIFEASSDAIGVSSKGFHIIANPSYIKMFGYNSLEEIKNILVTDRIAPSERDRVSGYINQRSESKPAPASYETIGLRKDGHEFPIEVSVSTYTMTGELYTVVVIRDISRQKKEEQLRQARMRLMEYSFSHTFNELLIETLNQVEDLTGSLIGFYHFLQEDQRTLTLQVWSTRTSSSFCKAEGGGSHYNIENAGVWVDCIHERRPVIHNNYASLEHKKGLPPGHAEVIRELAVPIFRGDKIVGILGIGNKPTDYTEEDIDIVSRFTDLSWDISERKGASESLRESNERFAAAFNNAPMMVTISNLEDGTLLDVNQRFSDISGFGREEAIGKSSAAMGWLDPADWAEFIEIVNREGRAHDFEVKSHSKSGQQILCKCWGELITISGRQHLLTIALDVTEHRRIEQQFIQAQKMESVGRLAGGVAHDFNNMLSIIIGHAGLALMKADNTNPLHHHLEEIHDAANRSAEITRQLLTFARKQDVEPKILDLNDTVSGMLKMLRRLIGEDIDLEWNPGSETSKVKIDPSQLDQIMANLCVNARDAISGVGKIDIQTENITLDNSLLPDQPDKAPGNYVMLTVSDNGCGIENDVIQHIFEPFYTTKELGKGTGLGLATVFGIVQQNGGYVRVSSEPGHGTTFRIYLPSVEDGTESISEADQPLIGGNETILLVEDELAIMRLGAKMLSDLGYSVLSANSPEEAIGLADKYQGRIDLLLTDIIMPGMNGHDLSEQLLKSNVEMKCLFMSGYTSDVMAGRGNLDKSACFMQKPFSMATLSAKVREALS